MVSFASVPRNDLTPPPVRRRLDFLWIIYLIFSPFYLFGSGTVQPANFLFIGALFVLITFNRLRFEPNPIASRVLTPVITCFALLALYVWLVDLFWSLILVSFVPVAYASYFLYNFLVFAYGGMVVRKGTHDFCRSSLIGVLVSVAILTVAALIFGVKFTDNGAVGRAALFFNNPNQLAYFALSCACIILVAQMRGIGFTVINGIGMLCCVWLAFLSLSKAGVACVLALTMIAALGVRGSARPVVLIGILVAGVAAYNLGLVDRFQERIQNTNAVFDNQIEGRGYDRILKNPQYLFLGAGEGLPKRFLGVLSEQGNELHSAIGTIVFCYGFPGLVLYLGLFGLTFARAQGLEKLVVLIPPLYGLTHNGLRFSIAWIVLIFILAGQVEHPRRGPRSRWLGSPDFRQPQAGLRLPQSLTQQSRDPY